MNFFGARMPRLSGGLRRFRDDESGNVAIILGLTIVVLMLSIGAAVDIGRWSHARHQTAGALDAAVLAGARAYHTSNKDANAGIEAAKQFYKQNVTSRLPVVNDTVKFAINPDGKGISASGNAFIKTPFLSVGKMIGVGVDQLPLLSLSDAVAEFGSGEAEVSIMLDVTGSMAGTKLQDLKEAALDLVDIVLNANGQTKIAIVPFSEDVRLPTSTARNKARSPNLQTPITRGTGGNKKTYKLTDCVVERTGNQKYTDAGPASNAFVMAKYGDNTTNCTIPSNAAIQPLTNSKTLLDNKINGLGAAGGTAGHLGTAWAWYTLSPNWNALWASDNQARPYNSDTSSEGYVRKIAVLMTDGEYNTQYQQIQANSGITANPQSTTSCPDATNGCSSVQAKALCKAMKEERNIEIFAVVFGTDRLAIDVMKSCASPDTEKVIYFYNATNGDQLKSAFRDIGIKMTQLYLSK